MLEEKKTIDFRKYPIPRVRHHVNPQVYLPATQAQVDLSWYPPTIETPTWKTWFANGLPASVLDIGSGRGGFLIDHALTYPDVNILGLEVRGILVDWTNDVIDGERIGNARAVWYSLANGLAWIADESITYATYLFPDPWPKARHAKRRFVNRAMLPVVARVLRAGAEWRIGSGRSPRPSRVSPAATTSTRQSWPCCGSIGLPSWCRTWVAQNVVS